MLTMEWTFENELAYKSARAREEGMVKGRWNVARTMLTDGESIDKIIKYTGLTVDDIISIKNSNEN